MTSSDAIADGDPLASDYLHFDRLPNHLVGRSVPELVSLRGQRVLVTGGAGPTLGRSICDRLGSAGAEVVVVDRDGAAASAVATDIAERWGIRSIGVAGDVTDSESVIDFVGQGVEFLGGLDSVVNSAGGTRYTAAGESREFLTSSLAELEAVLTLNLLGAMYVTHAVLPELVRNAGRLVIVASEAAKVALIDRVAYSAAKAGVVGMVRALAKEVGPSGVTVNAVCPGIMVSAETVARIGQQRTSTRAPQYEVFSRVSLERCCLPEEVANVVAILVSDAASYIHGAAISVSGGMSDW